MSEILYTRFCGCIYYQRVFRDGELDSEVGIYRDAEDGSCEKCMLMEETWKERVVDGTAVCNIVNLRLRKEPEWVINSKRCNP